MKHVKLFEQFVNEAKIEDPELAAKVAKYYDLQKRIDMLKSTLATMNAEAKELGFEDEIRPLFDSMKEIGDRLALTDGYIVKITRYGGTSTTYRYKEAFELALTKVNASTEKVLQEALESTKKISTVSHSFNVEKVQENLATKLFSLLKGYVRSFLNVFKKEDKNIADANKELEKIANAKQ